MKIKRPFRRPGKVILPPKGYENLFQLLAGYLNSDFDIYGPELKDAVAQFIDDCPVEIMDITRIEIADFLRDNADTLEDSLLELSSDIAREPGMSARDYLLWVDGLLAKGADVKQDRRIG